MFNKLFNFFRKKPKVNLKELGLIKDPRADAERAKDYRAEELVFCFPSIEWKEKPEAEWRKFPIFYQNGSGSCVAQAITKVLGIENHKEEGKFVHYSARDIYTRRSNYPGKGMWFQDGMEIGYKFGATFEQLMPSQGFNEVIMNASEDRTPLTEIAGRIGRGGNYIKLPIDIDQFASLIENEKKGVVIGVRFGPNEWNKEVPTISGENTDYGHAIVGTNAILYKGKKAIVIEDSWGTNSGINGRRILTKEWFDKGRVVFGGYFTPLKNDGTQDKIPFQFLNNLHYGLTNNLEVAKLQRSLAYLKFFPSGVDFTGNFYGITLKAVKDFQEFHRITPVSGFVGPITRQKLNELFA